MAANEAVFPEPEEPFIPEDSLANRLSAVRHHLRLTQAEAANICGLDDGSWSNWERGARPRNMAEVVEKVHQGLNVDRDWLMWGQNRKDLTAADLLLVHDATDIDDMPPGQMELPLRPRLRLVTT